MHIPAINNQYTVSLLGSKSVRNNTPATESQTATTNPQTKFPHDFHYGAKINFCGFYDERRTVPDIEYEEYTSMSESSKARMRKRYANFDKTMNKSEMFDKSTARMPLKSERNMDEFIKTASIYKKYKDQPIICLGRSPKWFLDTAKWMKDGIPSYKFVAFSKYWYRPDPIEGVKKIQSMTPNDKEVTAFRKYLDSVKADPQTIVDDYKKTGKKTVITDYISTGKGVSSFLDLMANYADDKGILEDFTKSIQIVGIGSMDYLESFYHEDVEISEPSVKMPEKLQKYNKNIKQEFYNMDYDMFSEILLNQNTNECRSTYYPHEAWTVYKPNKLKTGQYKDMKKIKMLLDAMDGKKKMVASYTPAMGDLRNLLNFRILDGLDKRGLLEKAVK